MLSEQLALASRREDFFLLVFTVCPWPISGPNWVADPLNHHQRPLQAPGIPNGWAPGWSPAKPGLLFLHTKEKCLVTAACDLSSGAWAPPLPWKQGVNPHQLLSGGTVPGWAPIVLLTIGALPGQLAWPEAWSGERCHLVPCSDCSCFRASRATGVAFVPVDITVVFCFVVVRLSGFPPGQLLNSWSGSFLGEDSGERHGDGSLPCSEPHSSSWETRSCRSAWLGGAVSSYRKSHAQAGCSPPRRGTQAPYSDYNTMVFFLPTSPSELATTSGQPSLWWLWWGLKMMFWFTHEFTYLLHLPRPVCWYCARCLEKMILYQFSAHRSY